MKLLHIKKTIAGCLLIGLLINSTSSSAAILQVGVRNSQVKIVQTMLKNMGYFKNTKVTGYYGSITKQAVKKFQKANGLTVDGIVGNATMKALNKKTSSKNVKVNAKVLSATLSTKKGDLDWFKEVITIWKRGVNAKVTDVSTGKSFTVKRTFGTNHADVEPLTKKDTNIIKSIWGGFSWERRAVVVEVNGHVLAGSMTAVPHAGVDSKPSTVVVSNRSDGYGTGENLDAVKNNGVSGVMDIHFKNSRTHSSNVMQSSHQNMVAKAAKYIAKNY